MDINKHGIGYEHKYKHDDKCQLNTTNQPGSQFPLPTISSLSHIPLSPRPSQDSQDLVRGIGSYVHPPTPEMDGSDGYRRRRALLASEKHQAAKSRRKKEANMHDQGAEPEDGDSSDFSSHSTGDDIELHYIKKENGLTDDEETGLDREDMKRRRRKKRKNTLLDQRVIGSKDTSSQDRNLADRSVLNALLINTLLIASWYFFSLSISIVSHSIHHRAYRVLTDRHSTINGCFQKTTSIFTSLSLQHVCICSYSFRLPPQFSTLCPSFDLT